LREGQREGDFCRDHPHPHPLPSREREEEFRERKSKIAMKYEGGFAVVKRG